MIKKLLQIDQSNNKMLHNITASGMSLRIGYLFSIVVDEPSLALIYALRLSLVNLNFSIIFSRLLFLFSWLSKALSRMYLSATLMSSAVAVVGSSTVRCLGIQKINIFSRANNKQTIKNSFQPLVWMWYSKIVSLPFPPYIAF